jgi:hypothetical protein
MNLCDDNHIEVCFEGRKCPVCLVRDELEHSIGLLNSEIEELKQHIDELNEQTE